ASAKRRRSWPAEAAPWWTPAGRTWRPSWGSCSSAGRRRPSPPVTGGCGSCPTRSRCSARGGWWPGGLAGQGQSAGRAAAGRAAPIGRVSGRLGTDAVGGGHRRQTLGSLSGRGAAGRWRGWHATAMSGIDHDDLEALLGPPATPAQRRRQQASQARFDHAGGLVERAAEAASSSDKTALGAAGPGARMEQMAFDAFEQSHPPSAALDYLLYDVVCDLVPDDNDTGFGQTWVDTLVAHADRDLAPGPARWVRLVVGLTTDENQLSNAELEAIERVRGGIRPDRDGYVVTWLAQADQRPRAGLLRDGVQALVWLRDFTWY